MVVLAVSAFVAGLVSTAVSLGGFVDPGVDLSPGGHVVESVSATGFAWHEGIRPGQQVVRLQDSLVPGDWLLETVDAGQHYVARAAPYESALRAALPLGVLALLLGGLAVVLLRGRRSLVAAAACAALLIASPAFALYGKPEPSTLVIGASAVVPAMWLAWQPRVPRSVSGATSALIVLVAGAWVVARLDALPAYLSLEAIRGWVGVWGTVGVSLSAMVIPLLRNEPVRVTRPRMTDIAFLAIGGGAALAAVAVFSVPVIMVGIVLLMGLLVLPRVRRVLGIWVERILLSDVREHAALEAAEEERARLARELHDVPLQEVAGILRRLELVPGAGDESQRLRAVADQLRRMATELRPPVLDDLGLAAAIEFVAEKEASLATPIQTEIENAAGLDAGTRPAPAVEVAIFRIVQEAISNAIHHSEATEIRVAGLVGPERIEIAVVDNGRGLVAADARAAARRGRLGLASMRRRAEAIDAELVIEGSARGTEVRIEWKG